MEIIDTKTNNKLANLKYYGHTVKTKNLITNVCMKFLKVLYIRYENGN